MRHVLTVLLLLATTPAYAKSGPTLHTREEIAQIRERCKTEPWAIKQREQAEANAAKWLAMSDEDLWAFILDAEIPRGVNVCFGVGSPEVGKEVFKKGGHYPWIISPDLPFKVKCPVTGKIYPTNDFEAYLKGGRKEKLDTTQPYVDDGFGYVAPDGKRYWFVAYYVLWQRWRKDIFGAMDSLNQAYLLTGDPKYAHKLGVMLGRMVEVYPKMDFAKQGYENGRYPYGGHGRILDHIWENSNIKLFARCYDGVYDALDADEDLRAFLAERGIGDLQREFEQKVLHFMADDVMAGRIGGNMYYQPTLATLAIVIDNGDPAYGPTTEQMVDWLLYGNGEIELILYNGFDRDGAGGETAPGYSSAWNINFCKVADLLIKLGVDVTANPRWRRILRFPYNVTLAGEFSPRLGDCGGTIHGAPKMIHTPVMTFGYRHFRDPQCAQLLLGQDVFGESLWGETLNREDVEQVAASAPDQTDLRTRNLGGYGLGVFDMGDGESRRSAYMYYGSANAWHGHHERLTIGYTVHGRDMLPEMGYPSHWDAIGDRFVRGMPSHYVVEMDEQRSHNKRAGYLDYFAAGAKARVMRAHAEAIYPGLADTYRRTFAAIDVGGESFLIDFFEADGGNLHDYHFHGLPFGEFSTRGLVALSNQRKGTLLGPEVPWGGDTSKAASGYDFFRNVRRCAAADVWQASWLGRDDCRLTYWMPAFPEVIVCDCEPPAKPDYPDTMEFIVVRNPGGHSRFPAVISASQGSDLVTRAAFEDTGGSMLYRVQARGRDWDVAIGPDKAFSACSVSNDGTAYGFFANTPQATLAGKRFSPAYQPSFTIAETDYLANAVTLNEAIPNPELLVGEVAVISGNGYTASYTVVEAEPRQLRFDGPAVTGMLVLEDVAGKTVLSRTRLSGYGTQISARDFTKMVLMPEDHSPGSPIASYGPAGDGASAFELAGELAFKDVNGDGRRLAYFAEYAPGYTVTFAPWFEVEKNAPGEVITRGNVPVTVE